MKHFAVALLIVFLASCSDGETTEDALLEQEPYAALSDSLQDQPNNAELYYKRGATLLQNNQLAHAEADLQKAWSLKKDEQYALGVANVLRKKNPAAAVQFLESASTELPQSVTLQIALARGYQQQGAVQKAVDICDQILAKHPYQLDALELKAQLLQKERKDEAIATLEKAYSLSPDDVELVHNLAFMYAENKNAKVLKLSDSLIKADFSGKHAEPYYFKGVYYYNVGNSNEALQQFNEAIQHDYNFLDAYMEKGSLLYDLKQYEKALETFNLALTVSPTFADAYYWRGKTLDATGDKQEAKLDYERAYGLDKTLKEAREAAEKLK